MRGHINEAKKGGEKMASTYFISCPNCRKRMRRTGKKEVLYDTGSVKVYEREYKCPSCDRMWIYNESRNFIR